MGIFTLDQSRLAGPAERVTKKRLESYARWQQFRFSGEDDEDIKVIGYLIYFVAAGRQRASETQ